MDETLKPPEATGPDLHKMVTDEDLKWLEVRDFLAVIQSPKPVGVYWADTVPEDFHKTCRAVMDRLTTSQATNDPVPDDVWAAIVPSSRAGLLRNMAVMVGANLAKWRSSERLERARRPVKRRKKNG